MAGLRHIWQIFKKSWVALFSGWKVWGILYVVNLFLAVLLSIPFNGYLSRSAGHSLALAEAKFHFNFDFIGDFVNNYGSGLEPILNQSLLFIILYFIVQSFFSGGIIEYYRSDSSERAKQFGRQCLNWFFPMFRTAIYFLLIHALFIAIFILIFILLLGGITPFDIEREGKMIMIFKIVFPAYLVFFSFIVCLRDYSKVHYILNKPKWLGISIISVVKWSLKNVQWILILFLFHFISFQLLNFCYQGIKQFLFGDNILSLFILFMLIQWFIFMRIGVRIAHLISVTRFFQSMNTAENSSFVMEQK